MKRFNLVRTADVSGVSGIGVVAQGCEFDDGTCAITWLSHLGTHAFYDSIAVVDRVHGHEGRTAVEWVDKK